MPAGSSSSPAFGTLAFRLLRINSVRLPLLSDKKEKGKKRKIFLSSSRPTRWRSMSHLSSYFLFLIFSPPLIQTKVPSKLHTPKPRRDDVNFKLEFFLSVRLFPFDAECVLPRSLFYTVCVFLLLLYISGCLPSSTFFRLVYPFVLYALVRLHTLVVVFAHHWVVLFVFGDRVMLAGASVENCFLTR
jgi:hypothetical protein